MTKYKVWVPIFVILVSVVIIVGIIFNSEKKENKDFNIVTTFYPVELIVDNMIKNTSNVKSINISAGVGGCVHDYELTPADMKTLQGANLVIINGQGMEHFVEHISLEKGTVIDSSINIQNKDISSHIWMDCDNYISQIKTIGNALCENDIDNAPIYTQNMNEYINKIEELKIQLKDIQSNVDVAIMHDSLKYYERLGSYKVSAQLLTGHEGNYSANEIRNFIEQIKNSQTKILLVDNETYQDAKQLVDAVQKETDVKVFQINLIVDVSDNLDEYIIKMQNNIKTLKEAIDYGK